MSPVPAALLQEIHMQSPMIAAQIDGFAEFQERFNELSFLLQHEPAPEPQKTVVRMGVAIMQDAAGTDRAEQHRSVGDGLVGDPERGQVQ